MKKFNINDWLHKDIDDVVEGLGKLGVVKFVDEKIDNLLDDDTYLYMRSYDVVVDSINYYVRLYFQKEDYIVTSITIREK